MDSSEKRQELLSNLLSAIKDCQIRFGGKSELATESENVIANLCSRFEIVLQHGLRVSQRPAEHALASIRDIVSHNIPGLNSTTSNAPRTLSIWPFVKHHLNRHELERYMLLKNVTTDPGRGRAWLRSSLNEHSLERYLHMMLGDNSRLSEYYEPWAFMVDQERSTMLPQMSAGLNSVLFAITIDNAALNYWSNVQDDDNAGEDGLVARKKSGTASATTTAPSSSTPKSSSSSSKKKKRKGASQVISFDDDDVRATQFAGASSSPVDKDELEKKLQTLKEDRDHEEEAELMENTDQDQEETSPSLTFDSAHLNSHNRKDLNDDDIDVYSKSPTGTDALSQLSIDVEDASSNSNNIITKLTPMKNSEIGALIPVSATNNDNDVTSEDSISIKSLGDDQDYASALSSIMATPQPPQSHYSHSHRQSVSSVASAHNSTLSREDLKQALLSVMERKDELQEQCSTFKKLLEKESSNASSLKEELNEANRKSKETAEKLQVRINSLSRENELLKHQLKKYVGAVQKLRDGPQAHETLAQLEGQDRDNQQKSSKYVDYHFEASEYEKKLIQVAEMHGELLEFNEHLQKVLHGKDVLIRRLREELVDLRGPLPTGTTGTEAGDDVNDDTMSVLSEAESTLSSNAARSSLISIWVPSVFLSGSSGTHHVYQVYLRIRDSEWNIYRRYSEFYALHKDLQKREALVASFDFPPKKTVGNKAEKFVEDRRKRLQAYLRNIVNLMVQTNPSLLAKPDKEQVILLMPFFAENAHLTRHQGGQSQPSHPVHQRPSLFQRRRPAHDSPATQLAL